MRVCITIGWFLACVLVVCLPRSVSADFTLFEIRPFFNNALGVNDSLVATVDFENTNVINDGATLPPDEIFEFGVPLVDQNGFGFPEGLSTDLITMSNFGKNLNNSWAIFRESDANHFMIQGKPIQIDFTDDSITAFAMDFELVIPDNPIPLEIRNSEGEVVFAENILSPGGFFGVIADEGDSIGSIRFGIPADSDLKSNFVFFDNLQLYETTSIPEPHGLSLLVASMLIAVARRRRLG